MIGILDFVYLICSLLKLFYTLYIYHVGLIDIAAWYMEYF